jgi:DNA-binding response OmpR family regulator
MRLLVVEDEPRLPLLLKRGFEEQGYVVDVTGDGAEALWLATETSYDTIVLDVMLPTLDGLEVTRRLRAGGSPGSPTTCCSLPAPTRAARSSTRSGSPSGLCWPAR